MLKKLFKRTLDLNHPDPQTRLAALAELAELTPEESTQYREILITLAKQDPESRVRKAAIPLLQSEEILAPMLTDGDPVISQAAADALAELYLADSAWKAETPMHPLLLDSLLRLAVDSNSVLPLLDEITDRNAFVVLALNCRSPEIRLAAAKKIRDEDLLSQLEKQSRNHDKRVNRCCREGLDEIRHWRSELLGKQELLQQLIQRAEQLSLDPSTAHRQHRIESLKRAVENARRETESLEISLNEAGIAWNPEELNKLVVSLQQALNKVEATLAETAPASDDTPAAASISAPVSAASRTSDANTIFAQLLEELQQLEQAIQSQLKGETDVDPTLLRKTRSDLEARWFTLSETTPHDHALFDSFQAIIHRLLSLEEGLKSFAQLSSGFRWVLNLDVALPEPVDSLAKDDNIHLWQREKSARKAAKRIHDLFYGMRWPEAYPLPHSARLLQQKEAELQRFLQHVQTHAEALVKSAITRLDAFEKTIEDGHVDRAGALSEQIRGLLENLPGQSRTALQPRYRNAMDRLRELKDWQTFATNPKREALCTDMENLKHQNLSPADQSARIKQLRSEWQKLGAIGSRSDRELLDRFNEAAEKAFEPCRAYFKQQSELRKYNQGQRTKICDELALYLDATDWEQANWKAAQEILFRSRDEWRRFHPVERGPGRKLQTRFQKLWNSLQEKIEAEWQRNLQHKTRIVERATEALESDASTQDKIDQVKKLQADWKKVGITERRVDQRLWKQFRARCDAVFASRVEDRERLEKSQLERQQSAASLCDDFANELANSSASSADPAVLAQYRKRFGELYESSSESRPLPESVLEKKQRQTFKTLCDQYQQLLREARHLQAQNRLEELDKLDQQLSLLEARVLQQNPASSPLLEPIATQEELDAALAEIIPEPPLKAVQARLENLKNGLKDPAQLNALWHATRISRRRQAINAEILARVETPAEDQKLRLEVQVERLNQGLRQGTPPTEDPLELALTWIAASATPDNSIPSPDSADALLQAQDNQLSSYRKRFFAACRILLG